ncbi:unnamed protein product [Paramecium sonneborni]|uniref:Uncharacterized protein n=1 Tax=Paramecium sonneborni TaxID=65129 RepID=A0A8S1Q8E8_9CILI|nr:unnamed protein product [Paramecium sonneborni]
MFKLPPSTNSQKSTPRSMKSLNSISHSNREVLMNEYFNLPMISTKSMIGNYRIIGTNLNKKEFNKNNKEYHQVISNVQQLKLVGQTEKSFGFSNYNFLEKYYQNKATNQIRMKETRKYNRLFKVEKIIEQRYSSLQQKNVQNLGNSTDDLQQSLRWDSRKQENQYKSFSANQSTILIPQYQDVIIIKNNEIEQLMERIDKQRKKLKVVFLFIFSLMAITKKYQLLKKEEKQKIILLNNKLQSCQKIINSNEIRSIEIQQEYFISIISNKVLHYLNSQTYINECNQIDEFTNPIQNMDLKQLRIQCFSKLIYQNLELLTRESNFPELLKCQLITSLFKTSKQQTSFFVGKRCNFYQGNQIYLQKEQKLAIAMEFLLFQIIIPKFVQIVNNLPTQSKNYKFQTQEIIILIASFMHRQFVNKFKKMKKVKNPNGYMVNRQLNIQYQQDGLFWNEITISNNAGDNNVVLEGLLEQEKLQFIENANPRWKQQLDILFEKILQNIEALINF